MSAALPLVLSCEHGGNRVPAPLRPYFVGAAAVLRTHRGFDLGALQAARAMARRLRAPLVAATVSRLVVDLNRSPRHRHVLSPHTAAMPAAARAALLGRYHAPHREAVLRSVRAAQARPGARGPLFHVAVHSFTPVLAGVVRRADIGLLYDPGRPHERALAGAWQAALRQAWPGLRVRLNYPYRGISDGLGTALRRRLPASRYAALEVEINQALVRPGHAAWARLQAALGHSLAAALQGRAPQKVFDRHPPRVRRSARQ